MDQDLVDGLRSAVTAKQLTDTTAMSVDSVHDNVPALMTLENQASIQQSVAFILQVYGYLKTTGLSVDDFIRSYTWRPIASMVDMFGSADLQFDPTGSIVVKGIEGFHSRAFGQYENLFALVTPEIEKIIGITRGSSVARKADTRKSKWDAVRDYVDVLNATKAILG
jgi:hypothetical protein